MRTGTPGFAGHRLREAREVRGIRAPALADLLGVSRAAISQYENEQATPSPEILRSMSAILNVPLGFFLRPQRPTTARRVFFRSRASATKTARQRGDRRLDWLADVAIALHEYVEFPTIDLSPFQPPSNPLTLGPDDIEMAAREARTHFGLGDGPISNVVWLLENKGVVVTRGYFDEAAMDSFFRWDDGDRFPLVFLNDHKSSAVRSRFDAAHELGHLLLHTGVADDYWRATDVQVRERQAHRFASAFLLPASSFCRDVAVPSIAAFRSLKPKWRVSIAAMIMRSEDIRLISEEHSGRLFRSLARSHWKTFEPLDDSIPVEAPRLLRKAFELLVEKDPELPASAIEQIALPRSDVVQLAMLPDSFFETEAEARLIQFRPPQRDHIGTGI